MTIEEKHTTLLEMQTGKQPMQNVTQERNLTDHIL